MYFAVKMTSEAAAGMRTLPRRMSLEPCVKSFTESEWSDDEVSIQNLILDGRDNNSTGFMNSVRVQDADESFRPEPASSLFDFHDELYRSPLIFE
jgi:hypothetical protein